MVKASYSADWYEGRPEDLPIVGRREIAMRAGVKINTVDSWIYRSPDFPQPFAKLDAGPRRPLVRVWWWPAVKQWLEDHGKETDAGWTTEDLEPERTYPDPKSPFVKR